ncbi:signal recognition particle protein [Immundisolibacter sp.]|uniref:signal recognition particle protein n=1 Tax=Immundisolibacter sp. TaxID=1934948 RepID=UPI00261F02F7|nr:signal recognition particle protein [Immundisolibacter sp.]MDD3651405.1 signal recognition particle protein [Immundisolibacter sp.]
MFNSLTERLEATVRRLRGQAYLTDDNIADALREVRMALLEADVALPVVRGFIEQVRQDAIGREIGKSLNPGQLLVKLVHDRLVTLMGSANEALNLAGAPPVVILMAGLQGSGKTTTSAKLARLLREQKKSVLLVSADVYRPAAIEQLRVLAEQVGAQFQPSDVSQKPVDIALGAVAEARRRAIDVVIVDTAGRLHVDADMMAEIKAIHGAVKPLETLFVVDSMTGQDAVNTAKAFHEALPLTGVILTKADGDARGGAALSIREVTGAPIKFLGVGEKIGALEPFHPERVASRILGMGDVVSLVEDVQRNIDREQAARLEDKLRRGKGFDFNDFRDQLKMVQNMGGLGSLLDKLPGMSGINPQAREQLANGKQLKQIEAIINSMTAKERRFPDLINGSRKRRIAAGAGVQLQDVNRLLKQFEQSQKMMKKLGRPGGMKKLMRGMGNMRGGFPGRG